MPGKRRLEVVRHARLLSLRGYVIGADGNVSTRAGGGVLITPSRVPYDTLGPGDLCRLALDGTGEGSPSSEREVHLAIYRARPDVAAVIHAHPTYACVLAANREPLPPVLDEVGPVLGGQVPVAVYALSGSVELAQNAAAALGSGFAVILANHGTVTVGADLAEAFYRLEVLERAAHVYLLARLAGSPVLL